MLGITGGLNAISALRLYNPLRSARASGAIRDFRMVEGNLEGLASDGSRYDSILIQRTVAREVYLTLAELGRPYLLDVDDNLLAAPPIGNAEPSCPWPTVCATRRS